MACSFPCFTFTFTSLNSSLSYQSEATQYSHSHMYLFRGRSICSGYHSNIRGLTQFSMAARGDLQSEPNIMEPFLFSFMLALHCGWGETLEDKSFTLQYPCWQVTSHFLKLDGTLANLLPARLPRIPLHIQQITAVNTYIKTPKMSIFFMLQYIPYIINEKWKIKNEKQFYCHPNNLPSQIIFFSLAASNREP
jgi:hypothetical protein